MRSRNLVGQRWVPAHGLHLAVAEDEDGRTACECVCERERERERGGAAPSPARSNGSKVRKNHGQIAAAAPPARERVV